MASPTTFRSFTQVAAIGIGLVSLIVSGCGTGEYNNRLQATVTNVGRRAAIEAYLGANATDASPDSGVRLRLPTLFDTNAKQVNPGEPRAKIGNVDIPGLVRASERGIDDAAGKFSTCYIYFAAIPKEGKPQDVLQVELQRAIAVVLPSAKWEPANLEKLAGGSVSYQVLKASGPQPFDATQVTGGNEQHEGQLELYLIPADKHWVLIGWRAPTAHATKYQFWDSVKAAMATVEVAAGGAATPAAPAAAPAAAAPAGDAAPAAAAPMAAAPNNGAGEGLPPGAVGAAAGIAPLNP